MSTITRTVYLTAYHFDWQEPGEIAWSFADTKVPIVSPRLGQWAHEVTLPMPDDFDPTTAQIKALEAEREKARADFEQTLTDINARIGKLLAITNEVEA